MPSSAVPSSPDVFVSLDAASTGRLGELARLLDDAGTSVVVDHHASNPGFGDVRLIDPGAPATVALVAGLPGRARRDPRRPARHLPLRGARGGHRLLPLRQHPARDARTGRPAAGDRDRPLGDQPPAVRHRAVRLARAAVRRHRARHARDRRRRAAWSGPGRAAPRRPSTDSPASSSRPWSTSSGRRRRPTSPACSRARTTAPGRCRCARAGATDVAPGGDRARRRRPHPRRRLQLVPRPGDDDRRPASGASRSGQPRLSVLSLAVPALVVLAAEPLYLLVDTAVVGHLGTVPARRAGRRRRAARLGGRACSTSSPTAPRPAPPAARVPATGPGPSPRACRPPGWRSAWAWPCSLLFQLLAGPLTRAAGRRAGRRRRGGGAVAAHRRRSARPCC